MRGRGAKAIPPSVLSRSNSGMPSKSEKETIASTSLRYKPSNIQEALELYPPFTTIKPFCVKDENIKSIEMVNELKKSFRSGPFYISSSASSKCTKATKKDIERYSDRYTTKCSQEFEINRISSFKTDLSCIPLELHEGRKPLIKGGTKRSLLEEKKKNVKDIFDCLEKKISLQEEGEQNDEDGVNDGEEVLEDKEDKRDSEDDNSESENGEDDLEDDTDYNMSYFENGDDYGDADDGDDGPVY